MPPATYGKKIKFRPILPNTAKAEEGQTAKKRTSEAVPDLAERYKIAKLSKGALKSSKVVQFHDSSEAKKEAIEGKKDSKGSSTQSANSDTKKDSSKAARKQIAANLLVQRQQLPIWNVRNSLIDHLRANETTIVLGETGSGKTTQIPQLLVDHVTDGAVACTQPRRVAAVSLATRVAAERGTRLGSSVGYTVRFDDTSSRSTRLKYITDGSLLAEMLADPLLLRYSAVVVDEAHERSLRTDLLLGLLRTIQARRRDSEPLRIVVMSATLEHAQFAAFFAGAPVLYVPGRQFPVDVYYAPNPVSDYLDAALRTALAIHAQWPPGDVLVFLPGQEEIDTLAASIRAYLPSVYQKHTDKGEISVIPLYAKLPFAEQARAFEVAKPGVRKIILATNIAETSVTLPGIKYVIDTGLSKQKVFHPGAGIDSLSVQPISQSSANQRTGRAGREQPGVCFRLYTEKDYEALVPSTIPEIKRVSLAFALLQLAVFFSPAHAGENNKETTNGHVDGAERSAKGHAKGTKHADSQKTPPTSLMDSIVDFPLIDHPDEEALVNALLTLKQLGALDNRGMLTSVGREMSLIPTEPVYARVLLEARRLGVMQEMMDLISLLSVKDSLFINKRHSSEDQEEEERRIRDQHALFTHPRGDHLTLLNVLKQYEEQPAEDRAEWCKDRYLNARSLKMAIDMRNQLRQRLAWDAQSSEAVPHSTTSAHSSTLEADETADALLQSLLSGFVNNTALLQPNGKYTSLHTHRDIAVHPSSVLFGKRAPVILYDEVVLTTKPYARAVSSVDLDWVRDATK